MGVRRRNRVNNEPVPDISFEVAAPAPPPSVEVGAIPPDDDGPHHRFPRPVSTSSTGDAGGSSTTRKREKRGPADVPQGATSAPKTPAMPSPQELKRLAVRRSYRGQTVELKPPLDDVNDPTNPFALDPSARLGNQDHPHHGESLPWQYVRIRSNGTMLKANSVADLDEMTTILDRTAVVAAKLGVKLDCCYNRNGRYKFYDDTAHSDLCLTMDANRSREEQVSRVLFQLMELKFPDHNHPDYARNCQTVLDYYRRHSNDPAECDYIQGEWDRNHRTT